MSDKVSFKSFVLMAPPLEDNSDNAFRTLCYNHGADVTFTEMTRLQGLVKKNNATWSRFEQFDDTPTVMQLLVSKEADLEKFFPMFNPKPGFTGFNMNMGCPSPDVIKLGLGCASLKRIARAQRLVAMFKDHGYQISIKLRLGMNKYEKEKKAYLNMLNSVDADYFILHARHGKQTYDEPADPTAYEDAVKTAKPIVANGDIYNKEQIASLKSLGVAGAMIGRASVYNPAIFDALIGKSVPSTQELRDEYLTLAKKFGTKPRYQENILHRMGRDPKTIVEKPSYQG
jgi:tRNA-dihydrouridine synthase